MSEKEEAIFRSAEMSLLQFYIPQEISRDAVYTLGELGIVQFRDLNSKVRSFQRSFVAEIRRLDNVQRQHRYFFKLLQKHGVPLFEDPNLMFPDDTEAGTDVASHGPHLPISSSIIDEHVQNGALLEERLIQMESAADQIQLKRADLEQYRAVLQSGDEFFSTEDAAQTSIASLRRESIISEGRGLADDSAIRTHVNYVTGVIPKDKVNTLEQILWRTLRGNLYFKHIELTDPFYDSVTKNFVQKEAFIIFSPGDLIIQRIRKIAESLDANLYDIDNNEHIRSQQLSTINQNLDDLYKVLDTTNKTLESELYAIGNELNKWYQDVSKEKLTFETLNKFNFDSNRKTLIAEGWVPTDEIDCLQDALSEMTTRLGIDVPSIIQSLETNRTPPTFHRTNKFTAGFQSIVDCYGIAQYREINAGLPTIVTFPFMFAIMFGDMGHGFIMFLAALVLVLNEKKLNRMKRDEIFDMAFTGRYIVLLMGLFSMYTGFLYNDVFSKSMTLFKSGWEWPEHFQKGETLFAKSVGTYAFGLDWAWHGTENALLFSNSYKMKLSILMGFIHMSYSYMFSLANHLYFDSMIDIIGNFIPGLIFMQGIFGYLSICIVYKWSKDWIKDGKAAPGLLNMLINMFLAPGTIDDELYPHQAKVQVFLLIAALICIPWLLLVKPLHFKFTHKDECAIALPTADDIEHNASTEENGDREFSNEEVDEIYEGADDDEGEGHHGEEFSDIMIHQVIHTIEFCLNCVSHTASYLRLWALSLAHAQLSTVLWTMTIQISFDMKGIVGVLMTFFLFAMWFVLTCAVLVVMEGTSAMLHSLRLHWVESMSKFFVGDGIPYEPFVFGYNDMEVAVESINASTSD
ncbi:H(+)-transporting V0 sector ATPase subunit a [Maudiozyma barnettii]|uniref:V-type proton ATPase subunit a n=1 Tax=Maudiozyma barnettii TaxID=61262 RepID=A0A8H2VCV5_9SACH|nr:H(+)-transporting V0 sector ATPase subunit a [Kazachstania barnettii]CAB4252903.1 similar to Saccharomyces cerevisiae YOR270C VPH1 Subunit a of vacuolar-ATPase V0 domain, one of two isoforms (Vph1p and Stv1p) [Kazachstania barnettii]